MTINLKTITAIVKINSKVAVLVLIKYRILGQELNSNKESLNFDNILERNFKKKKKKY